MDELHVHSMAGVQKFSKTLRPLQKPWIQSDTKDVQTLNYRHSMGVVPHMIWKYHKYGTSPRAASDVHPWGHLKCRVHMHFQGWTHSNARVL